VKILSHLWLAVIKYFTYHYGNTVSTLEEQSRKEYKIASWDFLIPIGSTVEKYGLRINMGDGSTDLRLYTSTKLKL
jgi:hypothetical protein